ncbi:MAG TPA: VWA domain-containing protein [Pyrinomonadaceae bacterium]|nr:VWA domain-containing protein [Pyrinomonadaceae bacterium]
MSKSSRPIYAFILTINLILTTVTAQQKPAEDKIDVIRINTELVQTHVTVLDKKGNFVTGLRPDQFQVQVDGKAQNISVFEEVTAGGQLDRPVAPTDPVKTSTAEKEKSSTGPSQPVAQRRTVFFFVDDMHLSPDSMKRTQDSLRRFVNETMGNSDQVAITTASAQLGFLQQLTNDKTVLRQAVERLKPRSVDYTDMQNPRMTEYQAYAIEQNQTDVKELFIERTCAEVLKVGSITCTGSAMSNNAVLDEGGGSQGNQFRWRAESMVKQRARVITKQAAQGILASLSSLESLVRTAAQLPERKLLVFVSDGFFINFASSTQTYDLKRITDFAMRYGTVIYTIDARGLSSGLPDASKRGFFDASGRMARVNLQEIRAGQQPLFNLAVETGGDAWLNSNDLNAGISNAINATSNYYLLAWRPDNQAPATDSFRRVKIVVKGQPDLVVRVAGGFFTKALEVKTNTGASAGTALSVDDQLLAALRGSYPSREVPITVSAGYLSSANEGLVVAASIQIMTDAEVDLMGAVADDKGTILSSLKQQLPAASGTNSLMTTLQFPKLSTGLVQVRVAARDSRSGRMGSAVQWIDLPDLSQNKFSVSSVFLSESAAGTQGTAPKWIIKPDRRFAKTGKFKFQVFVYNADQSAGAPVVHLQLELRREGQPLVQVPPGPIDTKGVTDLGRIPVVGEFPLADFPPGRYELKLIFTDQKTKSSVSREAEFTIL